jgi:membrane protein involved in colicin uptake
LGGLLLASGLASAQTVAVGLVDTGRVAAEYKAMQALNEQFNTFQREREQKLMERQKVMLLPEADSTKYFDLKQAAAPTDSTKKQLEDLETLAKQREDRFRALGEKQDRTAEEQKEFDYLNKLYAARVA